MKSMHRHCQIMKTHIRIFLAFLSCLLIVVTAFAYDISGTTLAQLLSQSPYNPYAGNTAATLTLTVSLDLIENGKDPVTCKYTTTGKFTSATWSMTTSVDLPNWVNEASATTNAQAEWNRWLAAAGVHENGHVQIANDFKQNNTGTYTAQLLATTVTGSGDTQAAATADAIAKLDDEGNSIGEEASGELDAIEVQYDIDTGHGETQGAVLDTSII